MFRRLLVTFILALAVGFLPVLLDAVDVSAQTSPSTRFTQPGFTDTAVASVDAPTALDFTPDGRMLVADKQGQLFVFPDGNGGKPTVALSLAGGICASGERGLLGVAVDPQFEANRFVYVYYTANSNGRCVNRVSRYILGSNNVATPSRVLLNNIYSGNNHNAGDIKFGKDGYLYVSIGDGGTPPASARDLRTLRGKILRVDRAGYPAPTNPYRGAGTVRCGFNGFSSSGAKCQEIFASGLRNPFRMAFNPNASSTSFLINDVGQAKWEEVNRGRAGADYGWDLREGPCVKDSYTNCGPPPAGLTNPIYSYKHSTNCSSITGGAFVPGNSGWPSQYTNRYLFGDFVCGKIFGLQFRSDGAVNGLTQFADGLSGGGPIAMTFGPSSAGTSQALYYTTYAGGVRRIDYTG